MNERKYDAYMRRVNIVRDDIIQYTADGCEVENLIQLQMILSHDLKFTYSDYLCDVLDIYYYSILRTSIENLIMRISWALYNRTYDWDWLNEFNHLIDIVSDN